MTVQQIVKINGITECALKLFEHDTNKAFTPYATYTLLMDERERNATVYKLEERYSGFEVVNYTIEAYI